MNHDQIIEAAKSVAFVLVQFPHSERDCIANIAAHLIAREDAQQNLYSAKERAAQEAQMRAEKEAYVRQGGIQCQSGALGTANQAVNRG